MLPRESISLPVSALLVEIFTVLALLECTANSLVGSSPISHKKPLCGAKVTKCSVMNQKIGEGSDGSAAAAAAGVPVAVAPAH